MTDEKKRLLLHVVDLLGVKRKAKAYLLMKDFIEQENSDWLEAAKPQVRRSRIHISDSACVACES